MNMTDQKELPLAKELVWQALNDMELLKVCIPGCESIEVKEDGACELLVQASVGPVKARFKGQMRMKDALPPDSYTLEFSGQGGAVGYCRGQAQVALVALRPDLTELRYTASANVGGKLAQVGARLIDMAAQKMATDFFDAFIAELGRRHAPVDTPATPIHDDRAEVAGGSSAAVHSSSVWARIASWFARWIGRA